MAKALSPTFAVIDVESTGGDPRIDRIIEIAIVIHNGKRVVEEWSSLVNPDRNILPFVATLTGINDAMVESAPRFSEILDKVLEMTEGRVFVGHNVRFDYTMVSNEFKKLGFPFRRRQLDTIKITKQLIPGLKAYGLGTVSKELDIPNESRHRALGDASATAILLDKLIKINKAIVFEEALKQEISENVLPPNLKKSQIDDLPEEVGVYYYKDEDGKIIFVGKSTNIRQRVLTHFSEDLNSPKQIKLKEKIHFIDYELHGNELIALIEESNEIKKWLPEFNLSQKRKRYKFGVYSEVDKSGYVRLKVKAVNQNEPFMTFTNKRFGDDTLAKLSEKYFLCKQLLGLESPKDTYCSGYEVGLCRGACLKEEDPADYNIRVTQALMAGEFIQPSFCIIAEGRKINEKGLIYIENNKLIGYGYVEEDVSANITKENIIDYIHPKAHTKDIQKIIFHFLNRYGKYVKIISFAG